MFGMFKITSLNPTVQAVSWGLQCDGLGNLFHDYVDLKE